ncbi:MAG: EamA family transporter [Chitinophagaceae bacterium]|nr:EamA family transporter [Chitinophagaceae bacterium]
MQIIKPAIGSSMRTKALFALGVVCILWGTTWVASKQGVMHMPALQLAGFRQLLAGAIYIIFFIATGAKWPRGREWYVIGVLSILNILCSNGLTTWGVQYISAGLGAIIAATFPLWMVIIGMFSSGDRIPSAALKGFLLGFAGICVIFYEHLEDFLNPEFLFGIAISFTASWTWAVGTVFTKKEARDFNPYFSLGLQMFMAGAVLIIVSYVTGATIPINQIPWQAWTAILYLVVFGSVIAFAAYLYSLQRLSVELMSIYAYINPIVAVILGAVLFNEKLTMFIISGGAITLYGVWMISHALRKDAREKDVLS